MSDPWEDFGGTTVEAAPWEDFKPIDIPSLEEQARRQQMPKPESLTTYGGPPKQFGSGGMVFGPSQVLANAFSEALGMGTGDPSESVLAIRPEGVPSGKAISEATGIPKTVTVPLSAAGRAGAGFGQFATSPRGILESGAAMIPVVSLLQKAKWVYDMAKGAGETTGDLSVKLEQAAKNPSAVTTEDVQDIADATANTAMLLYGAGKLSSHEVGALTGIRAPLGRMAEPARKRFAKDMAQELARSEMTPAQTDQAIIRQLGLPPIPPTVMQNPGMPELADAALKERMRWVDIPGQENVALNALRQAVGESPEVAQAPINLVQRPGGGPAPYGRVSYQRPAEAPLPERTQAAIAAEKAQEATVAVEPAVAPPAEAAAKPAVEPAVAPPVESAPKPSPVESGTAEPAPWKGRITYETYDEPTGKWEQSQRNIVVSKSTIPGDKPWRATVFAGPEDSPVAIGHIQLDSPTITKDGLAQLSEQLGRYTRKVEVTKPPPEAPGEATPAASPAAAVGEVSATQGAVAPAQPPAISQATTTPKETQTAPPSQSVTIGGFNLPKKNLKPNTVYIWGNEWSSYKHKPVLKMVKYEGDPLKAFSTYQSSSGGSLAPHVIMATDANGNPWKVITPNGKMFDFGTAKADYAAGDIDAFKKDSARRYKEAIESGDVDAANAALQERINEFEELAEKYKGYAEKDEAIYEEAKKKRDSGMDVTTLDPRYNKNEWPRYLEDLKRNARAMMTYHDQNVSEANLWRSKLVKPANVPAAPPKATTPTKGKQTGKPVGKLTASDWDTMVGSAEEFPVPRNATLDFDSVRVSNEGSRTGAKKTFKGQIVPARASWVVTLKLGGESVHEFSLGSTREGGKRKAEALAKQLESKLQPTPAPEAKPAETTGETKGIITGRAIEKWADDTLKGGATHAGPDVFAAYLVKGVALIERGVINFAEWSAKMIANHGPEIKPYLRDLFRAANETIQRKPVTATSALPNARKNIETRIAEETAPRVTAKDRGGETGLDDVYKIFEPPPKQKPSKTQKVSNIIEAFRTNFSSRFRPTNKLAKDLAKRYGMKPRDIAGIFEQLKGSAGKAEAEIYRFDRDVSSLVKGNERDFNAYMFLRRSLDRLEQDRKDLVAALAGEEGIKLNRRAVSDYTIPELQSKLTTLEGKLSPQTLENFRQAAERYQQYLDNALKLQVESGRMSKEIYDAIKSGNEFYAPFKVMKYLEENMLPEGSGRKIDTVAEFTKAMKGITDKDFRLGDMLAAARQSLYMSRVLADKSFAMQNISNLAKIDTEGIFIKRIKNAATDIPEGWAAVAVLENGKTVHYAVPKDVAESLQIFGKTGGGIISTFLNTASVPFKAGATALNVPFQVSNLLADTPRAALVSKYGLRGVQDMVVYPFDFIKSAFAALEGRMLGKDNPLYLDFLDSGVAGATIQEHLTPEALKWREPTRMSKAKRIARGIIYSPAEFAAAVEQTSKVLGVKRAMRFHGAKSGAELARRFPEAVTEIRRFSGSPDFGRQGKMVEDARLNLIYMFLNARIQGAVADVGRLTGREGGKLAGVTWARLTAAVGLPTLYLYAINNSDKYKDDYNKLTDQDKFNYWHIPKDSYITNEYGERMRDYWRIPKRESSKWIANIAESAFNFAQQRDPKAAKDFIVRLVEDVSPLNIQGDTAQERLESVTSSLNPLIKGPIEVATGRNMYRHRPLLTDTLQRASPEEQFNPRTAEAFKSFAKWMPDVLPEVLRSPIMLENMTQNLTAGMVTQFLSRKPVEGRNRVENLSLLQRFQRPAYSDREEFNAEVQSLQREAADQYLARFRKATELLEQNPDASLSTLIKKSGTKDQKLAKQIVDQYLAKKNGITPKERLLISLPVQQRAQYLVKMLDALPPAEQQKAILDLSKKRVLTEAVYLEIGKIKKGE